MRFVSNPCESFQNPYNPVYGFLRVSARTRQNRRRPCARIAPWKPDDKSIVPETDAPQGRFRASRHLTLATDRMCFKSASFFTWTTPPHLP